MMSPLAKTVLTNAAIGVGAGVAIGASAAAIEDEGTGAAVSVAGGSLTGTALVVYPIVRASDQVPLHAPQADLYRFAVKAQAAGYLGFGAAIVGSFLGTEALRGD